MQKDTLVVFNEFADSINQEAKEKGITEEELIEDLKQVRKEMWDERSRR